MRLINADEIQYAKDWVVTDKIPKVGGYNAKAIYRVTKEEIDAMPTVDTIPVVRCRDCKHCQYDSIFGSYWCGGRLGGIEIEADFFCKDGERKDGDNEQDKKS